MKNIMAKGEDVPFTTSEDGGKRKTFLSGEDGPFALVSWMHPGVREAHYHPTDQFQVVLEGQADFPGRTLRQLDVHYVDSRTAYGPFNIPQDGTIHAVLRRHKVGIVFMDAPPSYGKTSDPRGRQLFAIQDQVEWKRYSDRAERKVTLGDDGKAPSIEIFKGRKGAEVRTADAPHGEFIVFQSGIFSVNGELVRGGYSILYFEGEEEEEGVPAIRCETDDATFLIARYDRPASAGR